MKNKALFFLASTAGAGLTVHFSRQIVDMYQLGKQLGWDTFCVSDEKEQNVGIWNFVINSIPSENIIKFDEFNYLALSKKLTGYINQYEDVVIHFQGFTQLWHLRSLLNDHTRGVITIHSFPKRPLLKKYLKGLFYALLAGVYVKKVIFLSPFAMRGFVLSSWLDKQNKIIHIPFSIPINGNFEDSEIIEPKGFNVIYLANFLENKGHERYFVSMKKFADEHADVSFWFFGDGPRKNAFLKLIENAHMEKQMHCPGRVDRKYVPCLIKKSQLAMVLSRTETAGHAFIEPIMYGCPVIGTRVGFAEYLIQDYITSKGINNEKSLFETLQFAYYNQEEMKREALRLQKIINSLYDYQEMIKAYYMLYSEIVKL